MTTATTNLKKWQKNRLNTKTPFLNVENFQNPLNQSLPDRPKTRDPPDRFASFF
jgi:hypothetical protein